MKNKNILLVLLAYILLFVSAVFAGVNDETAMDLYGRISKITLDEQGNIKEVHLENTVEEGEPYDKVVVIITDETDIINGHISELKEGEIVGIVFKEGPIMMLYPPRIEAELIMFGGGEDAARIMVPVDLERERNDQKSVDEGHSPWKLDPVFVTQVFVSLEISPEGISGEYPVRSEELVLEDITEEKAVVSVRTEDSPISRVYLERLIKRGPGGIWTVTGYDLKEDEIIEAFLSLIDEKRTPAELIDFIDKNISYLSKESAADMIDKLERCQMIYLSRLEEKYFDDKIQGKLSELYLQDFNPDSLNDIVSINEMEDAETKELLLATVRAGFKVEAAEGVFYPVINYEFYKRYIPYLTADYSDYIKLMALESSTPPAADAALVIGWDQLIKRAVAQEAFLREYPESIKIDEVRVLYEKYLNYVFYGLNNTPLFDYDTKRMREEARNGYLDMTRAGLDSELIRELGLFMNLLNGNDCLLTEELDNYRKKILENILFSYEFYSQILKDKLRAMQKNIDILKEESEIQKIHESNYGGMYQMTGLLRARENELLFDAVEVVFPVNYKGHFTPGKRYEYYIDAAMGGRRSIMVKDDFGVWHSFNWRESIE